MRKEFFENLKAERTTYKEMIDFCCDNLVMNNSIMQELAAKGFYFDIENGTDYNEEEDYYYDVLDLYILGVCHLGTPWSGVEANWKDEIEE